MYCTCATINHHRKKESLHCFVPKRIHQLRSNGIDDCVRHLGMSINSDLQAKIYPSPSIACLDLLDLYTPYVPERMELWKYE